MPTPFSGGCACGAIRYECAAEPLFALNCHCRDCQRASGSAFCPVLYVPRTALTISGQSRYYAVRAASGNSVCRGFCPHCGSPVFIQAALVPDLQGLWAASLDDPSVLHPPDAGVDRPCPAVGSHESGAAEVCAGADGGTSTGAADGSGITQRLGKSAGLPITQGLPANHL